MWSDAISADFYDLSNRQLTMLDKLRFGKEKSYEIKIKIPKHIAITLGGIDEKRKSENSYENGLLKILDAIKHQLKLNIPITTFYLLDDRNRDEDYLEEIAKFIRGLAAESIIREKIKISVLGKWYNLPHKVVEPIKELIAATKDNDGFYANLCINYNGQDEIVDACRLIARKVKTEKIGPETIDKDMIKSNTYSSYFIPPEIIIVNGRKKLKTGLLLWDSLNSAIYFSNKPWLDFDKSELMDAINSYQKSAR
ncbi:hypothetical protein GF323_03865 [Candidatus Woesearchaeota archaeon]|nr:hypothetical protein [Candidatus Woesearchaeota archaeon]